jgi:hypothetical protein
MPIEVSFSGDEQTYEPIPKGNYEAFINSIQMKETQAKEPMANARFVIADGQFKGRSLFSNFVLREDLKWKMQNLILASGLHNSRTPGKVTLSDDWSELVGRKVGLKVADGEYNGEVRPEIRGFYRLDGGAVGTAPAMPTPAGAAPAKPATGAAAPPPPSAPAGATRRL